ncbi:MAG: DUF1552 domain-containing protein [Deltaproteobacteria bacterium]|nr:DUF1552 domain-containing protein [Deltaproteobacteria bacterium]MCB9788412.1 DUF1552 domain-containing protein [Deltaproteobacteria bacterium]
MSLSRRTLLKGMLGGAAVTVGLPAFERFMNAHGTAWADGLGFPTRFGLFYWGNGVLPSRWVPQDTGADWTLSDQLAPLAPVKDVVTVVTGMRLPNENLVPHFSGAAGLLTGIDLILDQGDGQFAGPTFDQLVAKAVGADTRFRSLEFGAQPEGGLSHSAKGLKNPAESSPHALFERVFGVGFAAPGTDAPPDPTVGLRRSVLDVVLDQARALRRELGQADALRLDQHTESLRELELRLAKAAEGPPDLAACALPAEPLADYPDIDARPQLEAQNRAFAELLAMVLACDQTRVFSNWFTAPVNNLLFPGATSGHHQLTHDEAGDQPQVHAITVQCVQAFVELVTVLRETPEGDGTLLDHMALLGTSEVALGRNHTVDEMPVLVAGSANGRLRTGIHHREPAGDNVHKVTLSLMRAAGVPAASFGEGDAYTADGLSAIET